MNTSANGNTLHAGGIGLGQIGGGVAIFLARKQRPASWTAYRRRNPPRPRWPAPAMW